VKRKIPTFRSQAEEAKWWYEHRENLDRDLLRAAEAGTLKKMDRLQLLKRVSASRVVSIRLPEADLAKARRQAARKGLPYQTHEIPAA
jgi:predicted DNA binding CopG/RHH family protein